MVSGFCHNKTPDTMAKSKIKKIKSLFIVSLYTIKQTGQIKSRTAVDIGCQQAILRSWNRNRVDAFVVLEDITSICFKS